MHFFEFFAKKNLPIGFFMSMFKAYFSGRKVEVLCESQNFLSHAEVLLSKILQDYLREEYAYDVFCKEKGEPVQQG